MTSLFGSGKALLWLSVIALMVATACIPISLLVFQGGPIWFVLGLTIPPSSLSTDLVFVLWYSIYLGSLAIYSFGFGYMLIKNHDRFNYGNLMAPGVFLLIQATFQVVNTVLANIALLPPYYFLSLKILLSIFGIFFSIFVTVVWFPYVGYQFRKLVYSGAGDGWDQFRQRLRENPTVQSFLARRMFGIIAMILSLIVTIEIMINSLLHISPYARFWWLALIGLLFGFVSLKFEYPNGYAITALCLGSLCWVAGSFLYSWSYYFL